MTGFPSKKAAAQDKLDDGDALTIAYQSGYYDGKKAAQERTWVGLTDEELLQLSNKWRIIYGGHVDDFAKEIEAKLRENNNG